ncbi:hypothetical protein KOW79_013078 [Hemibagrus wyckioides]|uniref:Uncharacterized protein n=1 Tax=Hemibagrus wyckioides TaxID=337641 RepID=A0A9D3SGF0_9TELE|nr:hypothetical protein KOW79_013078 [Hemibagrus wyckioides]
MTPLCLLDVSEIWKMLAYFFTCRVHTTWHRFPDAPQCQTPLCLLDVCLRSGRCSWTVISPGTETVISPGTETVISPGTGTVIRYKK